MRFKSYFLLSFSAFILLGLLSCNKKDDFTSAPLSDYMPLQVGKYITYRVDSVVYVNFGRNEETHRYQIKHVIDAKITDNMGRPAYRVFTYLNDSIASGSWVPNGTYVITPTDNHIEVTENNMRLIKLFLPLKEGFSWKGNNYISDDPYASMGYNFAFPNVLKDWDYYYDPFDDTFSYRGKNYTDICTVQEHDEVINFPVVNTGGSGSKYVALEKYAKNIGLVYREFALIEYEPNTSGPSPYYTGFGTILWMVDHN